MRNVQWIFTEKSWHALMRTFKSCGPFLISPSPLPAIFPLDLIPSPSFLSFCFCRYHQFMCHLIFILDSSLLVWPFIAKLKQSDVILARLILLFYCIPNPRDHQGNITVRFSCISSSSFLTFVILFFFQFYISSY